MSLIHITGIAYKGNPEAVPKQDGSTFNKWTVGATGTVDGQLVPQMTLEVYNLQMLDAMQPGWSGEMKYHEWQGTVSYRPLKKGEAAPPAPVPTAPPTPPAAGAPAPWDTPAVTSAPTGGHGGKASYSLEEWEALFSRAVTFVGSLGQFDADSLSRLVSTFIIGARDSGVKVNAGASVPAVAPVAAPPVAVAPTVAPPAGGAVADPVMVGILNALNQGGLAGRSGAAGVTDADLRSWWQQSGGAPNSFIVRVNSELTQRGQ